MFSLQGVKTGNVCVAIAEIRLGATLSIENKFRGYSPPPGKNLGRAVMKNSPPLTSKIRGGA